MLAPRKTLWSTPPSAVDHLTKRIPLQPNDCVCDIGCGDGRILLDWAQFHTKQGNDAHVKFIGIDIDLERIQQCHSSLQLSRDNGLIHPDIQVTFLCANALESSELYHEANTFFLYLIPRGLKLIHPLLLEHRQRIGKELRVATYMAKLPGETPVDRALCQVDHQPEAAWPLYFYKL